MFVRKSSQQLCLRSLMCDQAVALLAALHPWPYSATVLPTHTVTAGGRVSEEAESKAEGKEGSGEGKGGESAFQSLMCGNQMRGLAQIRSPSNRSDMLEEYH